MPEPFLVIATQNPIEYEGTFALPEAQLDRFMMRIRLGYPSAADEQTILDQQKVSHPLDDTTQVLSVEELLALQKAVREIYVDPAVAEYIVRLVNATRTHPDVYLGASPRGSLALYRTGQALAAADRSRLRDPGRRQGPGGGLPGPSPHHQDQLLDARHRPPPGRSRAAEHGARGHEPQTSAPGQGRARPRRAARSGAKRSGSAAR